MADEWDVWRQAAEDAEVDAALRKFYADLDEQVAQGGARCDQSGRCCKFDSFGHRLYVTALEVAWFIQSFEFRVSSFEPISSQTVHLPILQLETRNLTASTTRSVKLETLSDACSYQIDGLCSQHAIRPLGCRVFFCQPGTQAWQQDLYERSLAQLKAIHAAFDVPYRYLEWRAGLAEVLATRPPTSAR